MKIERFEAAGLKCIEVVPEQVTGDLPLIIGLHGRGDWGESYVDIGPMISETDYRYIFPTGPLPLEGALYEWFRLESYEIAREAAQARQLIFKLLNELSTKYNSPAPRTFLFGFSQGGMMTLEAGLRYRDSQGKPLAGLASLSGLLIADAPFNQNVMLSPASYYGADRGDLKKTLEEAAAAQIPVFIGHGS
jgi:predicted esterase